MAEAQKQKIWFFVMIVALGAVSFPLLRRIVPPIFPIEKSELTHSFRENIMRIIPTQGDILEVALLESQETLSRSDSKSLFDGWVYLGTTVSEIKVKVTYRYHIKLTDEWQLNPDKHILIVRAPLIRPSLPPAIHTQEMEKRSEAGWLRFNANENLASLEKSLTPTLSAMSLTPAKLSLVRDSARKSVEAFVRRWLLERGAGGERDYESIHVVFPGDQDPSPSYE